MANRLSKETSPYLLQHANNPVDWYPWGQEAFDRARAEDKPVLLSVGYAACHWCHVMERESFENEATAKLMNDNFIAIKVDREERPDVDSIYMQAVQTQTGRGGWPMTVFMTPEGRPFFCGTYFPPQDMHNMPGFPSVLEAIAKIYREQRDETIVSADQLTEELRGSAITSPETEPITLQVLVRAYQSLAPEYDSEHGGFGTAPKFPQPMVLEFLLRYHARAADAQALAMTEFTLDKMARGGMYDQLGGGFHRYSTDPFWLVPHFEKMLYDNALLSRVYLHAYQATGNPEHSRIVEETLDYVLREMTSPEGGFYSTQDADSEGEEGKFFLWTPQEIEEVVGEREAAPFNLYYDVTAEGNFEGRTILRIIEDRDDVAESLDVTGTELAEIVKETAQNLLAHRQTRVAPARDEKVLTAWNGMMLRTFAESAATLHRADYLDAAVRNASFLLDTMRPANGRLLRTYKDGEAKLNAYLEDYAHLADGLLALHEATLDIRWLQEATTLADAMLELFWDEDEQGFYDTGLDHEELILRPRDLWDNATPSGSSVATDVLLRLSILTGNQEYNRRAAAVLRSMKVVLPRAPAGFSHWLCALDFHLSTPSEIAIVGPRDDDATQALLDEVYSRYLPNKVLTGFDPAQPDGAYELPLLEDKYMVNDMPTAFVCQNYACQLPATEPQALAEQLTEG